MKLLKKLTDGYRKYYTPLHILPYGIASLMLYTALLGNFIFLFIAMMILCGISLKILADDNQDGFVTQYEDVPDAIWNFKLIKAMRDTFEDSEWVNRCLENEINWYQKIVSYVPFVIIFTLALVARIFIGIFDNMRYEIKEFNL
jgi:hypothetical protein